MFEIAFKFLFRGHHHHHYLQLHRHLHLPQLLQLRHPLYFHHKLWQNQWHWLKMKINVCFTRFSLYKLLFSMHWYVLSLPPYGSVFSMATLERIWFSLTAEASDTKRAKTRSKNAPTEIATKDLAILLYFLLQN